MNVRIEKLSELSDEELRREGETLAEQIFRLRFQMQTGNVENPSRIGFARRSLARVMTVQRERELGIERHRRASQAITAEPSEKAPVEKAKKAVKARPTGKTTAAAKKKTTRAAGAKAKPRAEVKR